MQTFTLDTRFLDQYAGRDPQFGFGGLGKFTFYRTYSRRKADGLNEAFWEVVARVVNGAYTMQKKHVLKHGLGWDPTKAQRSAQEMYRRIWQFKFSPTGRGFWAMGSVLTEGRGL